MAQRSTGIFPREGYNLDEALKATGASTDLATTAKVNLKHCKTVRVIAISGDADSVVTLGGIEVVPAAASFPYVAHVRGALLADSVCAIAGATPTNCVVYFEKVD